MSPRTFNRATKGCAGAIQTTLDTQDIQHIHVGLNLGSGFGLGLRMESGVRILAEDGVGS